MSSRHRSRELALQALYAVDITKPRGHAGPAGAEAASADSAGERPSAQETFESVAEHFEIPEGGRAFAKELVISVGEHQGELDETIATHTRNWRVSRMAAVDRNVLRIAAFELIHTQTPIGVVLDEAVELARRFGSDSSPAFVNGILDAIAHAVREPES